MVEQKIGKQFLPWVVFLIMVVFCISLIVPIVWALITSFKSNLDFIRNPFGLPKEWRFDNYVTVFEKMYITQDTGTGSRKILIPELFLNSFAWSFISALSSATAGCVVAYVTAKYKCKVTKIIYTFIIVKMILPIVGSLPSTLRILNLMGAYDNFWGLALTKFNLDGTGFLYFYAAFKGISWTYAEAAFLDGASHFKVMVKIMIPMIMPTYFALFLLNFIGHWNEWNATLIYIPSLPTLAYALYKFQNNVGSKTAGVPFVMISCMLSILPILAIFIAFNDKLMGSLSMGGLKG